MQKTPTLREFILENILWFLGSLALAFLVWMTAVTQTDPIEQWRLVERAQIRVSPDPGLIITNGDSLTSTASVQLRGQRSVRQLITADDVVVSADLSGVGQGTHVVPLRAEVARHATVIDLSPRQITVNLEVREERLKDLQVVVTTEPPAGFTRGETQTDVLQVTVSGPASRVTQVAMTQVQVDLGQQRTAFEDDIRVVPVDSEGNPVSGVTLDPSVVNVRIAVGQRPDVREVRVRPNVVGELSEGYLLTSFSYDPQVIFVTGPARLLESLPESLFTAPIDLSGRTSDFELSVPVELPDPELVAITGQNINVTVGITTQTITKQFDRVPIEVIGLSEGVQAVLAPAEVTVLVTGPQPLLEDLEASGVRTIVDVSGLRADDNYQLTPVATLRQGQTGNANISLLPVEIDVRLTSSDGTVPPDNSTNGN
jgi:YbbR domain-containing protein